MDLKNILNAIEVFLSVVLIILILLQQQGSGLGTMFGGAGGESYRSKRGAEKLLFNLSIASLVFFVVNGIAIAVLSAQS
ncbi:preprotein translocase subunit SecG [Candidatus Dojkabacteria bacterium]|uniref:Protein-export membrane protein SecG n=1 Tax=Candidatus Dojkabacteria bacterium TaxID=2099670 RepID=A0A955L589_9BACT|nr:preprotein translocase subunit SecG [Candidatus Dojkabacteria bacterium]